MLERLLPAINPEKPWQNVIWSFSTQGARGVFFPIGTRERAKLREKKFSLADQAPVVQTMDSAIHRINHYPVEVLGKLIALSTI